MVLALDTLSVSGAVPIVQMRGEFIRPFAPLLCADLAHPGFLGKIL